MKVYENEYYIYTFFNDDMGLKIKKMNIVRNGTRESPGLKIKRTIDSSVFGVVIGLESVLDEKKHCKITNNGFYYIAIIKWFFEYYKKGQWEDIKAWNDFRRS